MENTLADPLIGQREERVFGILEQVRDEHRAGHIETELIAPEGGFVLAVLLHFVRYGIHNVIAQVFIDTAVPKHFPSRVLLRSHRAARAHAHIAS